MKFNFKRKYTNAFFVALILTSASIAFFILGPQHIKEESLFFTQALVISLADIFMILVFIFGLDRVNYYLYHNRLEIHRSLRKKLVINYMSITQVTENPNDTILLMFGKRPSLKIYYRKGRKIYKIPVRVENHELFKLVIANEKQIHIK